MSRRGVQAHLRQAVQKQVNIRSCVRHVVEVVTTRLVVHIILRRRVQQTGQNRSTGTEHVVPVDVCAEWETSAIRNVGVVLETITQLSDSDGTQPSNATHARVSHIASAVQQFDECVHFSKPSVKMSLKLRANC